MADEATTPAEPGQEPAAATQEPGQEPTGKTFDENYVKQLRAENAAARKARQDLEAQLAEFEERDKTALQKAEGKVTKAEQRAAEAEAKLLRYEVATEKQVPAKLVPLLTATSREDLEAQAALILENAKPADPDFDGGTRDPAPTAKSADQEHNEFISALLGGRT
jgi:hypothetical protein